MARGIKFSVWIMNVLNGLPQNFFKSAHHEPSQGASQEGKCALRSKVLSFSSYGSYTWADWPREQSTNAGNKNWAPWTTIGMDPKILLSILPFRHVGGHFFVFRLLKSFHGENIEDIANMVSLQEPIGSGLWRRSAWWREFLDAHLLHVNQTRIQINAIMVPSKFIYRRVHGFWSGAPAILM
jgi:hypothetical protein